MRLVFTLSFSAMNASLAVAQPGNIVTGGGYAAPAPIPVAPGQIITLFVHGVGEGLSGEVKAEETPLPTLLAGISVALRQTRGPADIAAPLFSVRPLDFSCAGAFASECSRLTAITVQIPFELVPGDLPLGAPISNQAVLVVTENGVSGEPVALIPRSDNIHVVTTCDEYASFDSSECSPLVAHADGSLVSASNPARSAETLVLYAYGLGVTDPAVRSGEPSPDLPATVTTSLTLGFDFSPNVAPKRPLPQLSPAADPSDNPLPAPSVSFAGLSPGLVGLYQIHFEAPAAPGGVQSCGGEIQSNVTVSVGTFSSFGGAGICLETGSRWFNTETFAPQ